MAAAIGARYSNGAYLINCNAQFTITPTINGRRYPIRGINMMINLGGGTCQLALGSGNFGFWIFGDAFIRCLLCFNSKYVYISANTVKFTTSEIDVSDLQLSFPIEDKKNAFL
jgi:hypothetical protein